jgi:hypothetical protein
MPTTSVEYPVVTGDLEDQRFSGELVRDVGQVFERYGFPRVRGEHRQELADVLFWFFYVQRGPAGDLAARLNGIHAPLRGAANETGPLSPEDCCAAAHELRRRRGADGALVLAMDAAHQLLVGCAVDEGTTMDAVSTEIIESLEDVLKRAAGWKDPAVVKDLTFNVEKKQEHH